jgi:hypothetical protein
MPKLVSIGAADGGEVVIAVRMPQGYVEPVGAKEVIEKLDASLDGVFDFAVSAARQFAEVAKQAGARSSEIELGLGFTAKGTVFICETTGQATVKLKFVF